jgi:LysR family transcriptional regulator, mexEF-oprN operon transcriptional activator
LLDRSKAGQCPFRISRWRGHSNAEISSELPEMKWHVFIQVMHEKNFVGIDLNLLVVFAALIRERSATRAGAALGLSQSATSHALRRLRSMLRDPLFVRAGNELRPTPRATALHELFLPAIESIEQTLGTAAPFDPKTTQRRFRIGIPGAVDVCLTAPLIARLRRLAPVAALTVRQADVTNGQDLIETEAVDLSLSVFNEVRSGIVKQQIGQAGYSCIYDSARRSGQPISLDEYVRAGHVLTSFSGDHKGVVDTALAKLKRKRRIVVATQEFSSVPFYLHGTDLIATLPTYAARVYAKRLRLVWSPLPFPMPRLTLSLLWHGRFTSDAGHAWFRNLVRTTAEQTLLRD